jgi:hypothetical protein
MLTRCNLFRLVGLVWVLALALTQPLQANPRLGRVPEAPPATEAPAADVQAALESAQLTAEKLKQLDQSTYSFADRFVTLISDGCDRAEKITDQPEGKKQALRIKLHFASSTYSIVTGPSPLGQLLDLCSIVTLGHMNWVEEGRADKVFGPEAGAIVKQAFSAAYSDIWQLAEKYLSPSERAAVEELIRAWRLKNPDVALLAYVRFDDFAQARAGLEQNNPQVGGLFSAINQANRQIETAQSFAERAFYYSQRFPRLVQWQTERTVEAVLDTDEIQRVLDQGDQVNASLAAVAAEVQKIEQRQVAIAGLLNQVDSIVREVNRGVGPEARATLVSAQGMVGPLQESLVILERMQARQAAQPRDPDAKPIDIVEVRGLAETATRALGELRATLADAERLTDPVQLDRRLQPINQATMERVDHLFWRGVQLLALATLAVAALLLLAAWLRPRRG